eukprot:g9094.t1
MSDSERSDNGVANIHEAQQQATNANSCPLVALEFGDVKIGVTQDGKEDDKPQTGEQDQNKRKANRRLDSSTYEQISNSVTCDKLLLVSEARRRQNVQTGPARVNTAPAQIARVETQQALVPASADRLQGHPVTSDMRKIKVEDAFLSGILKCQSIDHTWLQGGSLGKMDSSEQILVERGSIYGDCCRLHYILSFILVTNKRFIIKRLWKHYGMNTSSEETSHHFADLQHVSVERGITITQIRNRVLLFSFLVFFAAVPLGSSELVNAFQIISWIVAIPFGIYNLVMFYILSNVNFLIIDIARANLVGSWIWGTLTRGTSYDTIRLPFRPEACFEVMNELVKRHPLLRCPENEV